MSKYIFTAEHKHNISLARKGHGTFTGHKHSEKTKARMRLTRKGRKMPPRSENYKQNLSIRMKLWWKNASEKRKKKILLSAQEGARNRVITDEFRERMRQQGIACTSSPERRKQMSLASMGNKYSLGCKHTLKRRLQDSELHSGSKSHLWQGGISSFPYPAGFNCTTRFKIRIRDNFTCLVCNISENGKKHHIHHIDYNKYNISSDNLVTLCHSCHTKTNQNREFWESYLSRKLYDHLTKSNTVVKDTGMEIGIE